MKNFSFKTKRNFRPSSEGKRVIFTVIGYTVVAILALVFLRNAVGTIVSGTMESFFAVREYLRTSTATLPSYLRSHGELQAEIETLRGEIAAKSGDSATIRRLISENEELRALLGDTTDERILAGVIGRPPSTPYDLLVIDRGRTHGVVEGAIVYHTHNHALGMVSRVYETMAFVTLFSSPQVESTVYLYGPDVFAYAYGEGGGVIRISLPQGIEVKAGDPVVLPSLHMGDLGVVERVDSVPTQPEQNAYLTFPIAIQSVRTVTVSKEPARIPDLTTVEMHVDAMRDVFRVEVPDALRLGTATETPTSTEEMTTP